VIFDMTASFPQWSEFDPWMFKVSADSVNIPAGEREVTLGYRSISTAGTQFLINGRKTFFRGTLECCIFPKTGHPPMDVESWRRIIQICQAHGLNLIRFHSWCPPEAAFQAADELGFYYQVEIASWANSTTSLGDGKPVDAWLYREAERILKAYGNHPSFVLMAYGNEPGGRNANQYLAEWVNHWKAADPRRLHTSGAGWPQLPESQFHVTPDPRIQHWGAGLKSRINARPPETRTDYRDYIGQRTVPVISHEIGQWCVYPNFDEIKKYTGYLRPKNFEIFRDTLEAHHLGDLSRQFLLASGKLQTLCYKEEIESALATAGKAIEVEPTKAANFSWYGTLLDRAGRADELSHPPGERDQYGSREEAHQPHGQGHPPERDHHPRLPAPKRQCRRHGQGSHEHCILLTLLQA
jgi:hypothetical protein